MPNDIITFSRIEEDGTVVNVSYTIPEAYNIYTFHRLCKCFAAACGYCEKNIEEVFGETQYEEDA